MLAAALFLVAPPALAIVSPLDVRPPVHSRKADRLRGRRLAQIPAAPGNEEVDEEPDQGIDVAPQAAPVASPTEEPPTAAEIVGLMRKSMLTTPKGERPPHSRRTPPPKRR